MKPIIPFVLLLPTILHAADWPTHRGNPQRTGSVDDSPLPKSPKILWRLDSTDHFIAPPVIADDKLVVSGLGAFNTATIQALALDPAARERIVWTRKPRQAVACPPAYANGRLIFGDGMHQNAGGTLHCISAAGTPIWQLSVPGALVHLEGAPTVAGGKVFATAGNGGVIALDLDAVAVGGKPSSLAEIQKQNDARWAELTRKYEEDKKTDPDFAIPPSEDQLIKPEPRKLWQVGHGLAGQKQWHVDAATNVAGDRVLIASAFLDLEKVGDRAVHCVSTADGKVLWSTPMKHNPWGGPTLAADRVIVGCSNIRYEPKEIPHGQGEVVALSLADGKPLWTVPVTGGVVAPVAVSGDVAVFCSTDGKVRALAVADGKEKWTYDAKSPLFASPAVSGGQVLAADLKGVLHAVDLASGKSLWTFDLAKEANAPGMIYGAPVVHGGRIYAATVNIDAPAGSKTVVVCIGDK